jgi:hypothetical protein
MYKLINPINPFGSNCQPIIECDEATKQWLIETEKSVEENFEKITKAKKNN